MTLLVAEAKQHVLDNTLSVAFMFSAKPDGCPQPPEPVYPDYYQKIITYAEMLLAEAKAIDSSVTATPSNPIVPSTEDSVFKYLDSNSSRALINVVSSKLKSHKIAIVGLGGTGSYVLDFVAKTPVGELHIFDGDLFLTHNAFRSPGAASLESLRQRSTKVAHFERIYSNLRNIIIHPEYITATSVEQLTGMDFVFICVDHGPSKKLVVEWLVAHNIPFADVGMEVEKVDDALNGCVRVTIALPDKFDHLPKYLTFGEAAADEYDTNIQIAELNALNAALAVIRWKKWLGFYQDTNSELDGTYCIDSNEIINEETSR
jgi:hypothetical protein